MALLEYQTPVTYISRASTILVNLSYHSESIPTFLSADLSKNNIYNGENIDREALKKLDDMFKL